VDPRGSSGRFTIYKRSGSRTLKRGEIHFTAADFLALHGWMQEILRENRKQAMVKGGGN